MTDFEVLKEAIGNIAPVSSIPEGMIPDLYAEYLSEPYLNIYSSLQGGSNEDYGNQFFTFEVLANGTLYWRDDLYPNPKDIPIYYSINNGNWIEAEYESHECSWNLSKGDIIRFYSNNPDGWGLHSAYSYNAAFYGSETLRCNVKGNVLSLINYDFKNVTEIPNSCFFGLFSPVARLGYPFIVSAEHLVLDLTSNYSYCSMFAGQTYLTKAPTILPAMLLSEGCYASMFYNCTSLTTAPELPAINLIDFCYENMFYDCTSLTEAPELPATDLVVYCYQNMFAGCSNLNYVKAMFLRSNQTNITTTVNCWLSGVSNAGTFVKNKDATWNENGIIPDGWTVQTA